MPTELPKLPPERVKQIDDLYASCEQLIDHYIGSLRVDMNRHKAKHGPMDDARAHHDITRLLIQQVPSNMIAGMMSAALLRMMKQK